MFPKTMFPKTIKTALLMLLGGGLLLSQAAVAKRLTLTTVPSDASIFLASPGGKKSLGKGAAVLKLEKDHPNRIIVEAEGFVPKQWTFPKSRTYKNTNFTLALTDRIVTIKAEPSDAEIFLDGGSIAHSGSVDVVVAKDQSVTVELRKKGFKEVEKTFSNHSDAEPLPLTDELRLSDRKVVLTAQPSDATIVVNGQNHGANLAEIVIPKDTCATVEFVKEGFVPIEKRYCHKEQLPAPPLHDSATLTDRFVRLRATPKTAKIEVQGREAGVGDATAVIPAGECVSVRVKQPGFLVQERSLCNDANVTLQLSEHLELKPDEAFTTSVASDQANVNFTIEVGEHRTYDDAWKLLSMIVLTAFDILEISDKDTGYLRTAWVLNRFEGSTVRTRLIVKQGDFDPIKFVVKIASEHAKDPEASPTCDRCFEPWDRVLYAYQDIINEMIFRLRFAGAPEEPAEEPTIEIDRMESGR